MGFPIFTERAKELLLSAQEDLRDAGREIDDAEAYQRVAEIVAEIDEVLDWEDQS